MTAANTYTRFDHRTLPDGRIETTVETNDDDGDGYDDGVTVYTLPPTSRDVALRSPRDKSHVGCVGTKVTVTLDGQML